jgi:hypothetical protein
MTWQRISVIAGLVLAGCTSYWSNPSQWQTKFSADAAFCESQASQGLASAASSNERHQQVYQQCMQGRGWPQSQERR